MKKGVKVFLIVATSVVVVSALTVGAFMFLPNFFSFKGHDSYSSHYSSSEDIYPSSYEENSESEDSSDITSSEEESSISPETTYTITWKNFDGEILEVDEDMIEGETPTYDGFEPYREDDAQYSYQFVGWSPEIAPVSEDATYTALFSSTLVNAKIVFDLNGGSTSFSADPIYRPDIRPSYFFFDLTKENYNFRGWSYNEEKVFDFKGNQLVYPDIKETMVFKAIFMQDVYLTINKNIDKGGTVEGDGIYDFNSQIDLTATPKPGYSFDGWYLNGVQVSVMPTYRFTAGNKDINLEARFSPNSYKVFLKSLQPKLGTVKFSSSPEYGVQAQKEITYADEVTVIANSLTQDYRFLGWFDANDVLVDSSPLYQFNMPYETLHLFAKWDAPSNMVNVSVNNEDGGYVTGAGKYEYTSSVSLTAHTSSGYQFDGWWNGTTKVFGQEEYIFEMPAEEVNLEARWSIINYSIAYDFNEGILDGTNPSSYTVNDEFTFLEPARAYYNFAGWYDNSDFAGQKITAITQGSTGNLHLYAKWEAIDALRDFTFTVDESNHVIITGLVDKSIDNIVIPNLVYSINKNAFSGCTSSNITVTIPFFTEAALSEYSSYLYHLFGSARSSVKHVIIAEGCTTIPNYAFSTEENLLTVSISSTVTSIGNKAFNRCSSLTSAIELPDSVLTIGEESFLLCGAPSISIGNGLTVIPERAFVSSYVTSVTFGDHVATISKSAFESCSKLTSLTLPENVKEIQREVFYGCSSLVNADLGQGLLTLGDFAFAACSKLDTLLVPETVTSLGQKFISADKKLTTLTMPSLFSQGIDYYLPYNYQNRLSYLTIYHGDIPENAFTSSSVKVVKLYDTEVINDYAFYSSTYLSSITFSNSLIEIGENAFYACNCLTEMNYLGTISEWGDVEVHTSNRENLFFRHAIFNSSIEDTSYVSVLDDVCSYVVDENNRVYGLTIVDDSITSFSFVNKFPNKTVISIATYGFDSCFNLSGNLVIPNGVRVIGSSAFAFCNSLTSITIPNTVEVIGDSAFYDCNGINEYVIPTSVKYIGRSAFVWCNGTIKCRASSKPDEWDTYWNIKDPNSTDVRVNTIWGYTG